MKLVKQTNKPMTMACQVLLGLKTATSKIKK